MNNRIVAISFVPKTDAVFNKETVVVAECALQLEVDTGFRAYLYEFTSSKPAAKCKTEVVALFEVLPDRGSDFAKAVKKRLGHHFLVEELPRYRAAKPVAGG